MPNTEYEILAPFVRQPWKKFTFKDIKQLTGKTSDSYVYSVLKKSVKSSILKEEKAGNVILYSPALSSMRSQEYLGIIAENISWDKKHLPLKDLQSAVDKIPAAFFTLIITGSYAKNKQTEKSDIDVVVIVEDSVDTKKVYAALKYRCEMNIPPIHIYIFRKSDFLGMLLNKEANYGKAIARNNLLIYGGAAYFRIIWEAIENGFNDKNLS